MSNSSSDLVAREVDQIIKIKNNATAINYDLILHTPKGDITITMLDSIEIIEDYNNNVGDYKIANFLVGSGEFIYKIKPYSNNLEMTVKKYIDKKLEYSEVFKAVIMSLDNGLSEVKGNYDETTLNSVAMSRISIQLVNKELEIIRSLKVDGIYPNTTIKSLLFGMMDKGMKSVKMNDEHIAINMNIVEPNNDNSYNHLVIPTGTRLLDLPTYLQDTSYGVYNGDIGVYFKKIKTLDIYKLNLFIFPLYTVNETPAKELFIYHTNNPYLDFIDTTYKVVGDIIKIVSTSKINTIEQGENQDIDLGNAITGSDPYNLTKHTSTVSNDKVTYDKTAQVKGNMSYSREDGMNMETYVGNESNLYKHRSKVIKRSLSLYQVTWNHSDTDLLIPGMVTTLFYQKDKEVKQLKGILQNIFTVYNESTNTTSTLLNIKMKGNNNG